MTPQLRKIRNLEITLMSHKKANGIDGVSARRMDLKKVASQ